MNIPVWDRKSKEIFDQDIKNNPAIVKATSESYTKNQLFPTKL